MNNRIKDIRLYVLSDYIAACITWIIFFSFRKIYIEELHFQKSFLTNDTNFLKGLLFIPIFWWICYFISNTYTDIYKKSRLNEFGRSIFQSIIGTFFLYFLVMLNDRIRDYQDYYLLFTAYVSIHLFTLLIGRLIILNYAKNKIVHKKVQIVTLLVGIEKDRNQIKSKLTTQSLPILSHFIKNEVDFENAHALIHQNQYEEAIIIAHQYEQQQVEHLIIECLANGILVKIKANDFDILSGKYKTQSIFESGFIEISPFVLTPFQRVTKRLFDIVLSFLVLILLSPFLCIIAIIIKKTSTGKILYTQERIGKNNQPFNIYKFRSMIENAEGDMPQLTQENDLRITKIGSFIRKYRIDELPQLFNVLKGDMSIVGPRPERRYFIDEISKTTPKYQLLQRIKPGITSLGMVKFGYAHNVPEMIQRMRYDILYIENMSISLDLKILFYTVSTVLQGKGK